MESVTDGRDPQTYINQKDKSRHWATGFYTQKTKNQNWAFDSTHPKPNVNFANELFGGFHTLNTKLNLANDRTIWRIPHTKN